MTTEPEGTACEYSPHAALSPEERRGFQDPVTMRRMFGEVKTIAVVGLSRDPAKPGHYVPAYLQRAGYRIIPVNPHDCTVLGEQAYPDLASVPGRVDLALVFRPGPACLKVAEQAIAAGVPRIWFQLNIPAGEGARRAAAAGLEVVMDRCMMVEHRALAAAGAEVPGTTSGLSKSEPTG
ncbi:MAG: CoA-binding domain protein [Gemmatimonadetes bacterium]|nr:CoA-binding domain protein [Gemmatimonadota bacterium]